MAKSPDAEVLAVFTGDCLFVGGCGLCIEGSYAEMWTDLSETLGSLPADTKLFPAHEYTVKNYQFGVKADPDSAEIKERLAWASETRAKGGVCVPTTVGEEWKSNIFLRCKGNPELCKAHGAATPAEGFAKLREKKNGGPGAMSWASEANLKRTPGMVPGKFRKK